MYKREAKKRADEVGNSLKEPLHAADGGKLEPTRIPYYITKNNIMRP